MYVAANKVPLAAVRSSTPDEDGETSSFAGVFETILGVTALTLDTALRECFASAFDHRVFSYAGVHTPSFAAVVMEMVDAHKAGVAFSANPLNSDRDEIMVDSSWGLGESVVDGSVVAGMRTGRVNDLRSERTIPFVAQHACTRTRTCISTHTHAHKHTHTHTHKHTRTILSYTHGYSYIYSLTHS